MKLFAIVCSWFRPQPSAVVPQISAAPEKRPELPDQVRKGEVLRRHAFTRPERPYHPFVPMPIYPRAGHWVAFQVRLENGEVIEVEQENSSYAHLVKLGDPVIVTTVASDFMPAFTHLQLDGARLLGEDFPVSREALPATKKYNRQGKIVRLVGPGSGCASYWVAIRVDDQFGLDFVTFRENPDSRLGLYREGDAVQLNYYRSTLDSRVYVSFAPVVPPFAS